MPDPSPQPIPPNPTTPDERRFTCEGSRAVDREAIEAWGLSGAVLMENAARSVADAIEAEIAAGAGDPALAGAIVIVCGPGNNGGDGWAVARHLANRRADGRSIPGVEIVEVIPTRPGAEAATNATVTRRMGVPVRRLDAIDARQTDGRGRGPSIVVDAILGTGVDRAVTGAAAAGIEAIARWRDGGARVVAVDVPSGLDADLGRPAGDGPAVHADLTVSFLGPKAGFDVAGADQWTGRVRVGDIGVPREILERHRTAPGPTA